MVRAAQSLVMQEPRLAAMIPQHDMELLYKQMDAREHDRRMYMPLPKGLSFPVIDTEVREVQQLREGRHNKANIKPRIFGTGS